MMDLTGGWAAFVERLKINVFGIAKKSEEKMKKYIHWLSLLFGGFISVFFLVAGKISLDI